jgi:hypothetical protein
MPNSVTVVAKTPFPRALVLADAAAHKFEGERLRAQLAAGRQYLRQLAPDSLEAQTTRDDLARTNSMATIHTKLQHELEVSLRKNSTFFQRNKAGAQKATIVLAIASEAVTFPFFVVSTAKMLMKPTLPATSQGGARRGAPVWRSRQFAQNFFARCMVI